MFSDQNKNQTRHQHKDKRKYVKNTWKLNNTFLKQSMDQRTSCKGNKKYTKL